MLLCAFAESSNVIQCFLSFFVSTFRITVISTVDFLHCNGPELISFITVLGFLLHILRAFLTQT